MTRKHCALTVIILLVALVLGCAAAGGYGRIRPDESGMTIQTLLNNWQDYNVYYAGDGKVAVAVVFDPKNDGKTLNMGPRWDRVTDQNSLNAMVGLLSQRPGAGGLITKLWVIVAPDGSTYGYAYSMVSYMVIKVIDDKTMLLESLS
jgi:hypothetical protein